MAESFLSMQLSQANPADTPENVNTATLSNGVAQKLENEGAGSSYEEISKPSSVHQGFEPISETIRRFLASRNAVGQERRDIVFDDVSVRGSGTGVCFF